MRSFVFHGVLAILVLHVVLACSCVGDDVESPGDADALSCCWLWPRENEIVECVRERIDPGCVVAECVFGFFEREVCTEEI